MGTVAAQSDSLSVGAGTQSLRWPRATWLLVGAVLLLYAPTLSYLFYDWWHNEDYSHGLFIAPVVAFFIWRKRRVLRNLEMKPTDFGLLVVLGSLGTFLIACVGGDPFTQRVSLLLFIAGSVLYLWGRRALSEIGFMLLLLLLAIPLPAIIFNSLTLPLQLIASSWAEHILHLFRLPVFREGNVLQLDQQALNVTEACSGIRSLATLMTAGVMVGYFLPARWWLKLFFVLSSIPVAVGANALRVAGTGVLGQAWGQRWAEGFLHLFSGWVVFVFATALLLGEWLLLQRLFGPRLAAKGTGP